MMRRLEMEKNDQCRYYVETLKINLHDPRSTTTLSYDSLSRTGNIP